MSTPESGKPRRANIWSRFNLRALIIVNIILLPFTAANLAPLFMGRQINGSVTCQNGDVTGVFVQAERLPRLWPNGPEIQSGFSHFNKGGSTADFDYWLPYGGDYTISLGCDPLKGGVEGAWGTDNRTDLITWDYPVIECNNPPNDSSETISLPSAYPVS